MALADSQHECYSSMANRYRQTDHATKTWPKLRAEIESMIQNNRKGASKDPDIYPDRHSRRIIYDDASQPPQKYIRAARDTSTNHYDPFPPYEPNYCPSDTQSHPSYSRAASYPPKQANNPTPNRANCVNCGGGHAGRDCDSLTCSKCQGTFPSAALRQAHYLVAHARVKIIAPDPSILRKQTKYNTNRNTPPPPTSPFMQRSAASTPTDLTYSQPPPSDLPDQAPDDSGYDSVFSNASTNDYQDSVYDDSAIAAEYLNEVRVRRLVEPTDPTQTTPPHSDHTARDLTPDDIALHANPLLRTGIDIITRQIIDNPAVLEDAIEHLMFDLYNDSCGIDTTHNVDDLPPSAPSTKTTPLRSESTCPSAT